MVYIVSGDTKKIKELRSALEFNGIRFRTSDWDSLDINNRGIYLVYEPVLDQGMKEKLRLLLEEDLYLILLTDDKKEELAGDKILLLPWNTEIPILLPIINWVLGKKAANICSDLIQSFFFEKNFQIFFLNKNKQVVFTVPEGDSLLDCRSSTFLNRDFEKIFRTSLKEIPLVGEPDARFNIHLKGRKTGVNMFKLDYTHALIPGAPSETVNVVFMNTIKNIKDLIPEKLIEKKPEQVKQKTVELLIANEIHHIQTGELQNAFEKLNTRNRQIMDELSLASDLQRSLLPRKFPDDLAIQFTHKYLPFAHIGGDFFDIMRLDEHTLGIIIADVSGHGVSAAFITAMFKSAFSHYAQGIYSPGEVMKTLNREFAATIHTEHYITAFYAILDMKDYKCTYANAGHPKQLLFHHDGGHEELTTKGFFIGMFENTEYEEGLIYLKKGDRLFFFTDGIIEVTNRQQKLFGRESIIKIMEENREDDITTLSNKLMSSMVMYMDDISFQDDITFLITEMAEELQEL